MDEVEELVARRYGTQHGAGAVEEIEREQYIEYLEDEIELFRLVEERAREKGSFNAWNIARANVHSLKKHYNQILERDDDFRYFLCDNERETRLCIPRDELEGDPAGSYTI